MTGQVAKWRRTEAAGKEEASEINEEKNQEGKQRRDQTESERKVKRLGQKSATVHSKESERD